MNQEFLKVIVITQEKKVEGGGGRGMGVGWM